MKERIGQLLKDKAEEIALKFSDPSRERNYDSEVFKVGKIIPLSEYTACVIFNKSHGKKGAAFFYWVNFGEGYWTYFFPTDSHILGMELFGKHKADVENFNYNEEDAK